MPDGSPVLSVNPAPRLLELDALRGVAALLVVLFHFTMDRPESNAAFRLGSTGVDLFFIISGFVIFMSLDGQRSLIKFIFSRLVRLYPTYWAVVTFTFLLRLVVAPDRFVPSAAKQYLFNLTMFQFYWSIPNLDDPYWTMLIEMLFYGAMVLIFLVRLRRWVEPLGVAASVAVAILSLKFSLRYTVFMVMEHVPLLHFLPLFVAGILFYKLYAYPTTARPARYAALLMCLGCQTALFQYGRSHYYISYWQYLGVLSAYFAVFALFVQHRLGFLVTKTTLFFGRISFALYLVHQYIGVFVVIPFLTDRLHVPFWLAALGVAFPLAVGLAFLITEYIEVPARRWLRALWRPAVGVKS